jgi:iron complex outermembrane receptor protein
MQLLIRGVFLTIAIALTGTIAFAQSVMLSGRVTAAGGAAVPGATIKLTAPNAPAAKGAYTDTRGRYSIKGIASGKYTLSVSAVGYQTKVMEDVDVSGGTLNITISETAIDMDVMVVTASRTLQKASEAPASVTVVEPREIREAPKTNPVEHIRGLAGVDYAQTGISQQNTTVRGFNNVFSGSLLTLTDYRPAGVPSLRVNVGYFVPASNEDIERMELVRGPGSALYGPNASSGVLNIITRSPFASKGTTLFVAGGQQSLINGGLRHAGTLSDNLGYKISGQYFSANDWEYRDAANDLKDSNGVSRRNNAHERYNVDGGLYYTMGENTTVQLTAGMSEAINTIEMTGLGAANGRNWRYTYLNAQITSGDFFAQTFYNKSDAGGTFFLRTGNPIVDKSSLLGTRIQHAYRLNDDVRFTYGADYFATTPETEGTINGVNENNDNYTEIGGYLQGDWRITSKLSALAAIRADRHSVINEIVMSPRVALMYKLSDNSSVRTTFNTAFSNPGTNDLFLDLLSVKDAFGLGAVNPAWSVGAWGASAGRNGYAFNRTGGNVNFISQFDPTRSNWIGLNTASAGGVWQTVTQIILPQLEAQAPANLRPLLRPFLTGIPAPQNIKGNLATLNPTTRTFSPMGPNDLQDVSKLRQTNTQTIEVGYQGKVTEKLRVAVDAYHSTVNDFVSPLRVVTPSVFLDGASATAYIQPLLTGALMQQGIPQAQAEALAAQYAGLIGGAYAQVPVGTASPENTPHKGDILLAYRNYGQLSYYGSDVAFTYEVSPSWSVSGSASYINQNVFTGADLGDPTIIDNIALNAPKYKSAVGILHRNSSLGLSVGLKWRWVDGFYMNSGVYVGDVNAYHMMDLTAQYIIPGVDGLSFNLSATNLLDNKVEQFIGASMVGRLVQGRFTYSF